MYVCTSLVKTLAAATPQRRVDGLRKGHIYIYIYIISCENQLL